MSDGWQKLLIEEELDRYYKTSVEIYHDDCGYTCNNCNGSGEGMADGTTCYMCKGRGHIHCGEEQEYWFGVEWAHDDLSDLEIVDGDPVECEYCGYDFTEDISYELEALREHE